MADHISISELFESMRDSLDKVKSLLAWKNVHEEEIRTNGYSSFVLYDPVNNDLIAEYAILVEKIDEMYGLINSENKIRISDRSRKAWLLKLKNAEREVRSMNIPKDI